MNDTYCFPLFKFENGKLIPTEHPGQWNKFKIEAHHWIKKQHYNKDPEWYISRGLRQKIIFLTIQCHRDLKALTREKFLETYGVPKEVLLFSKKFSKY